MSVSMSSVLHFPALQSPDPPSGYLPGSPLQKTAARADAGPALPSEGPPVARLLPGLPNTPIENLRSLWVSVVLWGLRDAAAGKDREWVGSDDWYVTCEYAGIDEPVAEKISEMFWAGQLDMSRITYALMTGKEERGVAA